MAVTAMMYDQAVTFGNILYWLRNRLGIFDEYGIKLLVSLLKCALEVHSVFSKRWTEKSDRKKSHGKKVTANKVTGEKVTIIKDQKKM